MLPSDYDPKNVRRVFVTRSSRIKRWNLTICTQIVDDIATRSDTLLDLVDTDYTSFTMIKLQVEARLTLPETGVWTEESENVIMWRASDEPYYPRRPR